MRDCPDCKGCGETHFSCCGDDVLNTEWEDIDLCPTCKEHLPGRERCDRCHGEGTLNEKQYRKYRLEIMGDEDRSTDESYHDRECFNPDTGELLPDFNRGGTGHGDDSLSDADPGL